jgi:hypothetical protein
MMKHSRASLCGLFERKELSEKTAGFFTATGSAGGDLGLFEF